MPAPPAIAIHDITKRYDGAASALAGLSLTVAPGESLAIVGPSGSGKSTLLNMVAGLDRPSTGSVTVDGVRVDRLNETAAAKFRRARIGMIFQFFNLLDDLTVLDNVLLPAQLAGTPSARARARADELLGYLGVARHGGAYPGRLSGGERQRVAVARALMNRPALLLADEPTGALDSVAAAQVRDLLAAVNADGQTLLLVTHDAALATSCASRTVELADGTVARDTHGSVARDAETTAACGTDGSAVGGTGGTGGTVTGGPAPVSR
ncbi:ABC transporter ATP-binding protein [Parafrankia sp. BMG5.11]|uniref:ABC transporter ATP-binding protein n=1 Tax=Parafrankia sp. BMG5.11 TaxID=222540 RepID=UPI00103EF4EE|nr:ABC transporter ATP-binding protein [Parafrankia sp. BMG5.11]TCJ35837.1 ABC transporter ATP-binding protein [Parafrankia sp. BMG5.11]